jgi:hypothetical protein
VLPLFLAIGFGVLGVAGWDASVLIHARIQPAQLPGVGLGLTRWRVVSTAVWSVLLDALPIGMYVLGQSGRVTYAAADWQLKAIILAGALVLFGPFVIWTAHSVTLALLGLHRDSKPS